MADRGTPLTLDAARRRPKVVLHDHLDGGLRPSTIAALARKLPYPPLHHRGGGDIAAEIHAAARAGSLTGYLDGFTHTVALTQTPDALERVAAEAVEDLAGDGVLYAEVRFAPELHPGAGSLDDVVDAVLRGVNWGTARHPIDIGLLLTVMRTGDAAEEVVACATRWRNRGVVGVDLAGDELAGTVAPHRRALEEAAEFGLGVTIHAGEAAGLDSIAAALDAGARRLGHGVRLVDDVTFGRDGSPTAGELCQRVIESGVVLEVCPSSNVHTGVVDSVRAHPIDVLRAVGVAVTVNADNRLMSATSASGEFAALGEERGWTIGDLDAVTDTALNAGFLDDACWGRLHVELCALRRGGR